MMVFIPLFSLCRLADLRPHFFDRDTTGMRMNDDPSVAVATHELTGCFYAGESAVDHVWQLQYVLRSYLLAFKILILAHYIYTSGGI